MLDRLKAITAALVLGGCVGAPAHAADAYSYEEAGTKVVFSAWRCKDPAILERVKPEFQKKFKAGLIEVGGEKLAVCWFEKDEVIHFIAAEGLPGAVPVGQLKPAQSL